MSCSTQTVPIYTNSTCKTRLTVIFFFSDFFSLFSCVVLFYLLAWFYFRMDIWVWTIANGKCSHFMLFRMCVCMCAPFFSLWKILSYAKQNTLTLCTQNHFENIKWMVFSIVEAMCKCLSQCLLVDLIASTIHIRSYKIVYCTMAWCVVLLVQVLLDRESFRVKLTWLT